MHTKGFLCCSGWSVILILDRLNLCGKPVLSADHLVKECSRPGNRTYEQTNVRLDMLPTVLTRPADISLHCLHQEHRKRPDSEQSHVGANVIFMKSVLPNDIFCTYYNHASSSLAIQVFQTSQHQLSRRGNRHFLSNMFNNFEMYKST